MTLVIAASNPNYLVQVSDRKLTATSPSGLLLPYSEEENKSIYWNLPSARFAVSYTGVARLFGTSTERFLCEELTAAAELGKYLAQESLEALRAAISKKFKRLPRSTRRLSVILTGFLIQPDSTAFVGSCLLTNFQVWGSHDDATAWDDFTATYFFPRAGEIWPTIIHHLGAWHVVDISELESIRPLLEQNRPPSAVVSKIMSLYPIWSKRSAEGARTPTVNLQTSSMVISADNIDQPSWAYHTEGNSQTIYSGATVLSRPDGNIAFAGVQITAVSEGVYTAVPQVGRRQPCPCGGGKQYRLCHGRVQPHRTRFLDR